MSNHQSPSERAGTSPEVIRLVAKCLADDHATLAEMCVVNKTWFEIARHVLWSHPPFQVLCEIEDVHRRQLHADAVTWLDVIASTTRETKQPWDTEESQQLFDERLHLLETNRFGRLSKLTLGKAAAFRPTFAERFFSPTLQQVEILSGRANERALQLIERCCFLTHLRLSFLGDRITPSRFLRFVQSFPRLQAIHLGVENQLWKRKKRKPPKGHKYVRGQILIETIAMALFFLASRPSMSSFSIGSELSPGDASFLTSSTANFRSVEDLRVSIDTSAVADFVPRMESLRDLKITLQTARSSDYPLDSTFAAIADLTSLRRLDIFLDEDATKEFKQNALFALESLVQLESLALTNEPERGPNKVEKSWLCNTLAETSSAWPLLRSLHIELQAGELTAEVLLTVGKNCPKLRSFALWGTVIGNELAGMPQSGATSYPQLEEFEVREAIAPGRIVAKAAEGLLWQMPKLRYFRRSNHQRTRETTLWVEVQGRLIARWNTVVMQHGSTSP